MSHTNEKQGCPAPVPYRSVKINGGFWQVRQNININVTQQAVYGQFDATGRFSAMSLSWREGQPNRPHIFFDSDIAKWVEGAAYNLFNGACGETESQIEEVINHIETGITAEGYFNSYYLTVEPLKRFTDRNAHELYCAGHLVEAAIAYADATGKERFLDLMKCYCDYICKVFIEERSASFITPGHEELELALIRLWRYTGDDKWLEAARFFIEERGKCNEKGIADWFGIPYAQDHAPVREQSEAMGHSVRWGYFYSSVADLAMETGDDSLTEACIRAWRNVVDKKMYVTGGIVNLRYGESFGPAYYLPNFEAYNETCASISMAMFAARMFCLDKNSEYGDIFELEMYNGILAGISHDGKKFFYENPLSMKPSDQEFMNSVNAYRQNRPVSRVEYFDCSCCPPNLLRFIASIGGNLYSVNEESKIIYIHHYTENTASIELSGASISISQNTRYPWEGRVKTTINIATPLEFTLAFRLPGWCEKPDISLPGHIEGGYYYINKQWANGDEIIIDFPMEVQEIEANPRVSQVCGRVALKRGPLVYCVEQADNGENLTDIILEPGTVFTVDWEPGLFDGIYTINFSAKRRKDFPGLYRKYTHDYEKIQVKAIPYFLWNNRGAGCMEVWLRKDSK